VVPGRPLSLVTVAKFNIPTRGKFSAGRTQQLFPGCVNIGSLCVMQNKPFNLCNFMTKTFCLLIFALFVSHICMADTIDYWHVYYNKTKLKECNQVNCGETLTFKTGNIKNGDSIIVKYFRDTPCFDCKTTLTAEDGKHLAVITSHGKGTFNPISISLTDLFKFKEQSGKDYFEIYYSEDKVRPNKTLLFRIKLE
jgi:hypothetical protein